MKNWSFLVAFLLPFYFFGQGMNPVKWEAKYNELPNNEAEIIVTATIEKGWHMYSINLNPDAGPIPTTAIFSPGSDYEIVGKPIEEGVKEEYDKMFEMKIGSFDGKAIIKQKLKRKNTKSFQTPIKIEYMVCNDKQCLPPKTIDIMLVVPAKK
ncbi:MAG: sugar transporter [Sphingobacteriaceae bacterium]|nr:sugar transporter [Sphingobacteriaceae bacterium]